MKEMRMLLLIFVAGIASGLVACSETDELVDFSEQEEILLGDRLAAFIDANAGFSVLSQESNPVPYGYAGDLLQNIVATDLLTKSPDYSWKIRILTDETRQAFVLPGGYLYVSTGMIFFLDNEDQFTGLLAHLVAHANFSNTVEILVFKYGINGLKSIAARGSDAQLDAIVSDLDLRGSLLSYTNRMEQQADSLAVRLLGRIDQSCEGSALAFEKVLNVQADRQVGMIAAHRLSSNRPDEISSIAAGDGCNVSVDDTSRSRFATFRNSLP